MNPDQETQKLIDEWLKQGNKIKKLPAGKRTDPEELEYKNKWGRGRKKKSSKNS